MGLHGHAVDVGDGDGFAGLPGGFDKARPVGSISYSIASIERKPSNAYPVFVEQWRYQPSVVDEVAQPRFGVRTAIDFSLE